MKFSDWFKGAEVLKHATSMEAISLHCYISVANKEDFMEDVVRHTSFVPISFAAPFHFLSVSQIPAFQQVSGEKKPLVTVHLL